MLWQLKRPQLQPQPNRLQSQHMYLFIYLYIYLTIYLSINNCQVQMLWQLKRPQLQPQPNRLWSQQQPNRHRLWSPHKQQQQVFNRVRMNYQNSVQYIIVYSSKTYTLKLIILQKQKFRCYFNPYLKVMGCVIVCLYRSISIMIWFSITVLLLRSSGQVQNYLGYRTTTIPREINTKLKILIITCLIELQYGFFQLISCPFKNRASIMLEEV